MPSHSCRRRPPHRSCSRAASGTEVRAAARRRRLAGRLVLCIAVLLALAVPPGTAHAHISGLNASGLIYRGNNDTPGVQAGERLTITVNATYFAYVEGEPGQAGAEGEDRNVRKPLTEDGRVLLQVYPPAADGERRSEAVQEMALERLGPHPETAGSVQFRGTVSLDRAGDWELVATAYDRGESDSIDATIHVRAGGIGPLDRRQSYVVAGAAGALLLAAGWWYARRRRRRS